MIDRVTRQYKSVPPPDIEGGARGIECQGRGAAGDLDRTMRLETAGLRVHQEPDDPVIAL